MRFRISFLVVLVLGFLTACQSYSPEQDSEADTQTTLTISTAQRAWNLMKGSAVPCAFYLFKDGSCIQQIRQTLGSAVTFDLPGTGSYILVSLSNVDSEMLPSEVPSLSQSVVKLKPGIDVSLARDTFVVSSLGQHLKKTIVLQHQQSALTLKLDSLPADVQKVTLQLPYIYNKVSFDGRLQGDTTLVLPLTKAEVSNQDGTCTWNLPQSCVGESCHTPMQLNLFVETASGNYLLESATPLTTQRGYQVNLSSSFKLLSSVESDITFADWIGEKTGRIDFLPSGKAVYQVATLYRESPALILSVNYSAQGDTLLTLLGTKPVRLSMELAQNYNQWGIVSVNSQISEACSVPGISATWQAITLEEWKMLRNLVREGVISEQTLATLMSSYGGSPLKSGSSYLFYRSDVSNPGFRYGNTTDNNIYLLSGSDESEFILYPITVLTLRKQ